MTIARSIVLICLVLAVFVFSSLTRTAEAARYHLDDINSKNSRHRHRHRHEAPSVAAGRRNHDFAAIGRGQQWSKQDDDYEDGFVDDEDDDDDDGDYEMERSRTTFHDRSYQPLRAASGNHHSRYEPRFPLRHHRPFDPYGYRRYRTGGGIASGTSSEDDAERRRWHYEGAARNQRPRSGRDRTYHDDRRPSSSVGYQLRNYEDFGDDDSAEQVITDRENSYDRHSRRWRPEDGDDEVPKDHRTAGIIGPPTWWNSGRYRGRHETRRTDWKARTGGSASSSVQRNDGDDWTDRRKKPATVHRGGKRPSRLPIEDPNGDDLDNLANEKKVVWASKRSKSNVIDRGFGSALDRKKEIDDVDYRDYEDASMDDGETTKSDKRRRDEGEENDEDDSEEKGEEDKNEDEDSVWKEAEEDPDDEEEYTFDTTNYYKTEDEPPYKTFDDIIASLTSDDSTTSKSLMRRDYRNIGIEKYLKHDAYGNMYDSRNVTALTRIGHDAVFNGRPIGSSGKWRFQERKPNTTIFSNVRDGKKLSNAIGDVNGWKGRKDNGKKNVYPKHDDPLTRTKSLEQEYDEDYDNNEKDEDTGINGGEHVTEMQADINNTEYVDEDNETETEDETTAPLVTLPSTTTTTTTTTTPAPTSTTSTTTTTTPKPVTTITRLSIIPHDRRDLQSYGSSSTSHSNGLQHQSTHGAHKWQSLNTRDNFKDTKGHGQQNSNRNGKSVEIHEALQHAIKVSREGSCQWPRARVIPVRDVYPSPSTTYMPHCAILHRCSDDTGCCRSEALTCVPKVSHRVELYFYTTRIEGAGGVEKLSFYNHTECECKERDEDSSMIERTSGTNEHRYSKHHTTTVSPPQNIRRSPPKKPCKCPSEFTAITTPEGDCQCNCADNRLSCIRMRRGRGYFSHRDRLCIQNEGCATPSCEFGEYMRRQGKCPKKKDKFDAIANHPSNVNLHHRFRS